MAYCMILQPIVHTQPRNCQEDVGSSWRRRKASRTLNPKPRMGPEAVAHAWASSTARALGFTWTTSNHHSSPIDVENMGMRTTTGLGNSCLSVHGLSYRSEVIRDALAGSLMGLKIPDKGVGKRGCRWKAASCFRKSKTLKSN